MICCSMKYIAFESKIHFLPLFFVLAVFSFSLALPLATALASRPVATVEAYTPPSGIDVATEAVVIIEEPVLEPIEAVTPSLPVVIQTPAEAVVPEQASIAAIIVPKIIPEAIVKPAQARILIPSINVNAAIKDMGLTPEGAMAVPDSNVDTGWFSYGTRPGETGSAVIGGHNDWNNAAGVFYRLEELSIGDVITVVDAQGVSTLFVVRETRMYNPTDDATGIFTSASGAHLNVITCSGVFDATTNSYTKRFVVFADLQTL